MEDVFLTTRTRTYNLGETEGSSQLLLGPRHILLPSSRLTYHYSFLQ